MSLKYVKFNGQQLLVQYTTDADNRDGTCIDKIFYSSVNVEPLFDENMLQRVTDLVMKEAIE